MTKEEGELLIALLKNKQKANTKELETKEAKIRDEIKKFKAFL